MAEIQGEVSKLGDKSTKAKEALAAWRDLPEDGVTYPLRQKGLDITTMTLKQQVDTVVLVTGDSGFVPRD